MDIELITKLKIKDTEMRELINSFLYKKGLKLSGLAKQKGDTLYKLIYKLYEKYEIQNINDTLSREINELREVKKNALKQKKIEQKEQQIRNEKAQEQQKKYKEEQEKEIEKNWNNGVMNKLIDLYKYRYTHRNNEFKIHEIQSYTDKPLEYWEGVKQENKKRVEKAEKWKKEIEDKFKPHINEKLGDYIKMVDNETIEMKTKGVITHFNSLDTRSDTEKKETLLETITAITHNYMTILDREYDIIERFKKKENYNDYLNGFYVNKLKPLINNI